MKTIVYSNGDGHDLVIYDVLQVPDEMTKEQLPELWTVFKSEFYPDENRDIRGKIFHPDYEKNQAYIQARNQIIQDMGYDGYNEDTLFISWLCKNHGCRKIEYEEWY